MSLIVKHPDRDERVAHFRYELAREVAQVLALQPLIDAGIVHITPSEIIQNTKEPGKIYVDDLYGSEASVNDVLGERKTLAQLPAEIAQYSQNHLRVLPAKYVNKEPIVLTGEPLAPRNMIAVGFPDDTPKFYQLFSFLPEPDGSDAEMRVQMHFDIDSKESVNPIMFENWVNGSKFELVSEILSRLQNDLVIASMARAKFITDLGSSRDLATLSLTPGPVDAADRVTSALLKIDLPFFEGADFASIARARRNEAAFMEFVTAMDKAFSEIEALPDSPEFQNRVNDIYRDLLIRPLADISRQMNILKRNLFLDALILVGSLAATFITQGNTLVTAAAILASTKMAEMYKQDKAKEDEIKQFPSFFYWEATQRAKALKQRK